MDVFIFITNAASKAEQQRIFACLALASAGQIFRSWPRHPAVCGRRQEHKTKEDGGVFALCTLSEGNLYPSSLPRVLDCPPVRSVGQARASQTQVPFGSSQRNQTSTLILGTKGKWRSWERREQPPFLYRSRVTALTKVCRRQEEEALRGWELHSSYFPLKEVMCLTQGSHRPPHILILHEPQTYMTLTLGPSGPGQPTGPGSPGTPGGPGLPFKDQEQKSRYLGMLPSSQE